MASATSNPTPKIANGINRAVKALRSAASEASQRAKFACTRPFSQTPGVHWASLGLNLTSCTLDQMGKRKGKTGAAAVSVAIASPSLPLWERSWVCAAALAAAVFIFYSTPLFSSGASIQWDAVDVHLSAQRYFSNHLRSGHLPYWTPYIFSGFPFLADPQVGAWYPLNWPFFLAGVTPRSIEWELFVHALIACFGAYYLSIFLLKDRPAALVAGVCYGLSGFFAGHSSHVGIFQTAALFPWLLLAFAYACSRSPMLYGTAAGLCGACMILAGHFQTSLYAFFGLALFALGLVVRGLSTWRCALSVLAQIAAIAVLTSAIQTLPGLELAQHSVRADLKAASRTEGILPVKSLSTLFYPNAYGVFDDEYKGPPDITQYYFYAGILLLPLATYGLRDPGVRTIGLVLAIPCIWYALGPSAGLYHLMARLPGFASVRAPVHIWFIPALALALAASSGMCLALTRWNRAGFVCIITLMVFMDVFYQNSERNRLAYARISYQDLYGKGEDLFVAKVASSVPPISRFHSPLSSNIFGSLNHPLDAQLETTYGYNPLELRAYADFMDAARTNPRLLNALNVSRLLDESRGAIVENPGMLPRAFFARHVEAVSNVERVSSETAKLATLDPADVVLWQSPRSLDHHDPAATANIAEYTETHYRIATKTAAPSLLAVSVPFYPGWQARVDGKPVEITPADHALIGVEIPAGEHQLTLDYHSTWFLTGALLSLAGLCAGIALIVTSLRAASLIPQPEPH
jgi:hypothetical protein